MPQSREARARTIPVRQVVDWSAALWAGFVAGTALLVLGCFAAPQVVGINGWVIIRLLASSLLGPSVMAPPATFDATALLVGLLVHYVLTMGSALLLAIIIYRWGLIVGFFGGAAFGLAIFAIAIYTFTLLVPQFLVMQHAFFAVSFVVFGAIAGTVYELLEIEEFVPIEPSPAPGGAA